MLWVFPVTEILYYFRKFKIGKPKIKHFRFPNYHYRESVADVTL